MRCIAYSRLILTVGIVSISTACSTPQALMDQANNSANLTISLQAELASFRVTQTEIAQHRLDSIGRQLASMATYQIESDFDERISILVGSGVSTQLYTDLRKLADSRGADEKLLAKQLAEIDADLAKVLSPLPSTTRALSATQKALAVLGQELSSRERFESLSSFARTIKNGIDDNKKKIEDARTGVPNAPVQPPAQ